MARYIDADGLIKKIFPYDVVDKKIYAINAEAVYKAIQNVTTADVVEVVRCEKCKYGIVAYNGIHCGNPQAPWTNDYFENLLSHDDFCSYGERKEK